MEWFLARKTGIENQVPSIIKIKEFHCYNGKFGKRLLYSPDQYLVNARHIHQENTVVPAIFRPLRKKRRVIGLNGHALVRFRHISTPTMEVWRPVLINYIFDGKTFSTISIQSTIYNSENLFISQEEFIVEIKRHLVFILNKDVLTIIMHYMV
jgi:hypothetical protein